MSTPPTLRAAAPSSASCCRPDRPSRSPGGPRRRRRSAPGPPRQGHHGPPPRPSPRPLGRVRRRRASTHMRGPRRCRPASRSGRSAEATPHAPRSGGSRPQPWRACAPGTHAPSHRSSVVFACAPAIEMRKPWPRVRPSGAVPRDVSRSAMSPSVTGRPVGSHPCQPTSLPSAHTLSRGGGLVAMSADYCRRTEGTALQDDLGAEDGQDREDGGDLGSGRSGLHAGDRRLAQSGQAAELRLRQPPPFAGERALARAAPRSVWATTSGSWDQYSRTSITGARYGYAYTDAHIRYPVSVSADTTPRMSAQPSRPVSARR